MATSLSIRKRIVKKKKEAKYAEQMEVRDAREAGFFHIDNLFHDEYVRVVGIHGLGVYASLCRHCNRDQKAWPSINLMSDELAASHTTIVRALKMLESHNIVKIDRKFGEHSIYTLTNRRKWRKVAIEKKRYRLIDHGDFPHGYDDGQNLGNPLLPTSEELSPRIQKLIKGNQIEWLG
jgi:hypothetical protein